MLVPVSKAKIRIRKRSQRVRPVTRDDSLFRLIGIGKSDIGGDGSERKHEILARAYRPRE